MALLAEPRAERSQQAIGGCHGAHPSGIRTPWGRSDSGRGGSGGVSDVRSDLEGAYARAWARNIWADTLM